MDTNALKKFAQSARSQLMASVKAKMAILLAEGSTARREHPTAVRGLEGQIRERGEAQVVEQVAYIWFNRFTALRFMDVNGYTGMSVLSPAEGQTRPEVLAEAMAGHIDETVPERVRAQVAALLDGRAPSADPQGEAYRLLLVAACNQWHAHMPFLFEPIEDFTELLLPDDLLSLESVPAQMRSVMSAEACQDVEVIGWLYQFYISEKKDRVFADLKKNIKITPENIPAATQLFTPHWIVRYLVENSLGRLWLLNRPGSKLAERMEYYIAPEEPETDFLRVGSPNEIKVCDPACGSGHMLTYAFDLLHAIYEEEGYDATEIPALILTHNLTGVEIDDRAGALAAFALAMKAAAKLGRRRFLRIEVKPTVVVLKNVSFSQPEMQDVAVVVGRDLFTDELRETLGQFEQAKNFGSLVVPKLRDPAEAMRVVEARNFGDDLLLRDLQERVVAVLHMAETLSPKYHAVVTNPPYMGGKGINLSLSKHMQAGFFQGRADLFSAFTLRCLSLSMPLGFLGLMTPFTWMFLSSFEGFRNELFSVSRIITLVRPEYHAFFESAYVPICAFAISKAANVQAKGTFIDLSDFYGTEQQHLRTLEAISNVSCTWRYVASAFELKQIPGSRIAYWINQKERDLYSTGELLSDVAAPRKGMDTGENERFLRLWHELSALKCDLRGDAKGKRRWFPYNKGGEFRRWYGNRDFLVNWECDGQDIKSRLAWIKKKPTIRNSKCFFKEGFTWTTVSSGGYSARYSPKGAIFDNGGCTLFADQNLDKFGAFLNSVVMDRYLEFLAPTLNFQPGDIGAALFPKSVIPKIADVTVLITLTKSDWDAYEISWDFTALPLLATEYRAETLAASYARLRADWQGMTDDIKRLEEENNRIFIDAYGLQDELTPEVPIEKISVTCNPAYRYGVKGKEEERESRLCADTIAEFLHYAVGCMFGRYSLDAPGLILANQGDRLEDYLARVSTPSFAPDTGNVIPVLDGDWFTDDITERFRQFLRVTFGLERFRENLAFIEAQVGDIRKYFTSKFYEDHLRRYKKRPIYWMFSSLKGTFQALIYMHRYRPDTVSVLLNDYLRELIRKLEAERVQLEKQSNDSAINQGQRTKALKASGVVAKQIVELTEWERDVIFPLAQQKIEIDLDDGVKANYPKFGAALKPIKGLEAADV